MTASTPHVVSDTITDTDGSAVAGALVHIRDSEGALVVVDEGNPLVTDSAGFWEATLLPGTYYITARKGDDSIEYTLTVCQDVERTPFLAEIDELPTYELLDIIPIATIDEPIVLDCITIEVV